MDIDLPAHYHGLSGLSPFGQSLSDNFGAAYPERRSTDDCISIYQVDAHVHRFSVTLV